MAQANTTIVQTPIFFPLPVGQPLMFVVQNPLLVSAQKRVKFIAEIFLGTTPPDLTTDTPIGIFKTTPNNTGVGMFDVSNVVENYVKSDHLASSRGSTFKGIQSNYTNNRHPLHLVDKFSTNLDAFRYIIIRFSVEYLGATNSAGDQSDILVRTAAGSDVVSDLFPIFNGYLKFTDKLIRNTSPNSVNDGFGYPMYDYWMGESDSKFLTNSPRTVYANVDDYGTLGFLTPSGYLASVRFTYYDCDGGSIGSDSFDRNSYNGAYNTWAVQSNKQLLYLGCYPANLRNWSTTFITAVNNGTIQGGRIDVRLKTTTGEASEFFTIKVNCPELKGFEPIRLCWLNQWGVWDYYTFIKKSVRTLSTKGTTYNQLAGTWNSNRYYPDGYKGGKKPFRVNTTEKIKINTDFITETNNYTTIFEEMMNSPEVYMLKGFDADDRDSAVLNTYVTPVRLTTSSFVRKTVANDKLIQYTFEIEKSNTLRTQSV